MEAEVDSPHPEAPDPRVRAWPRTPVLEETIAVFSTYFVQYWCFIKKKKMRWERHPLLPFDFGMPCPRSEVRAQDEGTSLSPSEPVQVTKGKYGTGETIP